MDNFPHIIATARKNAKLTQESFAARLGITPQAVSKWENGVGYPDITLFPTIAQVLNIPIAHLFGQTTQTSAPPAFPKKYNGLPLVLVHARLVCYSSKTPAGELDENNILHFTDGSFADWNSQTVTNVGPGEIRLYHAEDILPELELASDGETVAEQDLAPFRRLSLTLSLPCEVQILPSEDGKFHLSATGDPRFLAALHTELFDEKLSVELQRRDGQQNLHGQNRLILTLGASPMETLELLINGSSDCRIQPDFHRMQIKINGSGDVQAETCDHLTLAINGSGDAKFENARATAQIYINGSGDVSLAQCHNPQIGINGSGDVQLEQVSGELSATISGSGDIRCLQGDLTKLTVGINGSGDFLAEGLTTQTADLRIEASGHISIGRIIGASREAISKNGELHVARRG